jgi:hypothetical protein
MTQAFNLSQFANKVNTSGQADLTTAVSGTLPVANGGTGVTSAGTSGNILTSNGTAWVSQAPSGGGVTSLNGQTGAITNTTLGAIGSYVIGSSTSFATETFYAENTTVSGSTLINNVNRGAGWSQSLGAVATSSISVETQRNLGLSGTWRLMCGIRNDNTSFKSIGLFVRIS